MSKFEQVWSIQEAINRAVEENRPVRFIWKGSRNEILKSIVDIRGCELLRPDRDSEEIAVVPPGINDFDFETVNTTVTPTSNIWIPPHLR
jgi:hypothetical protein